MINLLLPDQIEELRALERALATAVDYASACRELVTTLAAILDAAATLLDQRGGRWRMVGHVGDVPPPDMLLAASAISAGNRRITEVSVADRGPWTRMSLRNSGEKPLLLMFAGDWTLSQPVLEESALRFSAALRRLDVLPRGLPNRKVVATYAFARRVARVADPSHLHQIIVDTFATAVNAQKASLAIYDPEERALSIAATSGYPLVLVKHLRFREGSGVIRSVYRSRRPLRVEDIRTLPGAPAPRLRYRTPSFISVPLIGTDQVLGVVSVADRADARAFDRRDLNTLRGLTAIAALALDRVHAVDDARGSAHVAAIDSLTGLFNRRPFHLRLDEEVERARRQASPLTALMLDVDNFKQVNDRLGHLAGDAVLRVIGEVLRRSVRLFDVCARYGGDEFAILMPGSGAESSAQIAERIREGIEDSRPTGGPWSDDLRVTASIGIASFAGTTGEELIARADQALYAAKRDGRNRVHLSGSSDLDV